MKIVKIKKTFFCFQHYNDNRKHTKSQCEKCKKMVNWQLFNTFFTYKLKITKLVVLKAK